MTTKRHKYLNAKSYQTRCHRRDDKEHKEMQNDYKKEHQNYREMLNVAAMPLQSFCLSQSGCLIISPCGSTCGSSYHLTSKGYPWGDAKLDFLSYESFIRVTLWLHTLLCHDIKHKRSISVDISMFSRQDALISKPLKLQLTVADNICLDCQHFCFTHWLIQLTFESTPQAY